MKIIKPPIALLFLCFLSLSAYAQKDVFLGLAINSEFLGDFNLRLGGGLTFEKKFKEHHGFETGIFYRNNKNSDTYSFTFPSGEVAAAKITVLTHYISFPFQYKHYSSKMNFSIGVNFDHYEGWTANTTNENVKINSVSSGRVWRSGICFKASKSYQLTENFILEPELRSNIIFNAEPFYLYAGVGLIGKFNLSKSVKSDSGVE